MRPHDHSPRGSRPIALMLAGALLTLVSCTPGHHRGSSLLQDSFAHALAPASHIETAVPGRALVLALKPPPSATDVPPSVFASIDDGEPIPGAVYFLTPPAPGNDPWLGAVGAWQAHAAENASRQAGEQRGLWVAVLVLPADARPDSITVNARIVRLRWLEPATRAAATSTGAFPPTLAAFLANVQADPAERWRERLLRERLEAQPSRDPPLAHPALELLAVQTEDRWRTGIRRARAMCGDALADTLLRTLTAFGVDEEGRVFPVWPTDPAATGALLGALLDEALDAGALESRARAFLAAFPPATAWMHDDAGDPAGALVGLADLQGAASAATIAWRAAPELRPEMGALPAFAARTFSLAAAGEAVDARLASWSTTLPALTLPIPARPPGVTLGPLRAEHSLEAWRAGVELVAPAPAAALLRPALAGEGWELFLQCAGAPSRAEHVRVHIGPTAAPTHVLRISPDGAMIDERSPMRSTALVAAATPDSWSVTIPLPREAVASHSGPLRIAIERTDAQARRSSWPRPMFPWQLAPGRAAIDLSAWSGP